MKTSELTTLIASVTNVYGIMPRIKSKKDGSPSPTTIACFTQGAYRELREVKTEQEEYDWVHGCLPTGWRGAIPGDDLTKVRKHHIKLGKKSKDGDAPEPTQIPSGYTGLQRGDVVIVPFGGSGSHLGFALSRKAEMIGATTLRITPYELKKIRTGWQGKVPDNATLLVELALKKPELLQPFLSEDRNIIRVAQALKFWDFSQFMHKGVEQRVWGLHIGELFCDEAGEESPSPIKQSFDKELLTLVPFRFWRMQETQSIKRLEKALNQIPFYTEVLLRVDGIGPRIAGGIIGLGRTPFRFDTVWKFAKYYGVHCNVNGTFPRMKREQPFGGNPEARQTLYQLADMSFTFMKDSEWGLKLRAHKARLREKWPVPLVVQKEFSELWRAIDRFFRRNKVVVFPEAAKIETVDALFEFYTVGAKKLAERAQSVPGGDILDQQKRELTVFAEKIEKLGTSNETGAKIGVLLGKISTVAPTDMDVVNMSDGTQEDDPDVSEEAEENGGKSVKLFTPAHIHKMAMWATLNEFIHWLYGAWWDFETKRIAERTAREEDALKAKAA